MNILTRSSLKCSTLSVCFLLVGCSQRHDSRDRSNEPQVETQKPGDDNIVNPEESGKDNPIVSTPSVTTPDKPSEGGAAKPVNPPQPVVAKPFMKTVKTKEDEVSGCIEVMSRESEPKTDMTILAFLTDKTSNAWQQGSCPQTISVNSSAGSEITSIGKCRVDPKKKIQGPGVSDEPAVFVNYYTFQKERDPNSDELNTEYLKLNKFWLTIDTSLCQILSDGATTYERNQKLWSELFEKKLI